jgi:predicted PhzF superfamily epimerase YddE/YHI9
LVFENEDEIRNVVPRFDIISELDACGVIVTAKGDKVDFVSRFFAPQAGVNEDPVTCSAHTTLIPYWSSRLGKNEMTAIQLSERKGHIICKFLNERVEISGQAKLYMIGDIFIGEDCPVSST